MYLSNGSRIKLPTDVTAIKEYDFITLSNIILYAHYMYKENHLQKFKELIGELSKNLNINGNIVVGYLYDIENEDDAGDIYKQQIINT